MMTSRDKYAFLPISSNRIQSENLVRDVGQAPMSSFCPGASFDKQHDMLRSFRDLDIRLNFIIGHTMFKNILFDLSRRGEHDAPNIYIQLEKIFVKNVFLFRAKYLFLSGLDNDRYLGAVNDIRDS